MEKVDAYSFDDKTYILIEKIENYLYLSNEKDPHDMMIRKEDSNDPELLLPLKDDEELNKALSLFHNKTSY